jgi:cell division septation protein DedD
MASLTSKEESYLLDEQSEDTEITLGTGKMLFLFFGLVALCAVFFGMGFKVGRNSVRDVEATSGGTPGNVGGTTQASGTKPSASQDMSFYKAVEQKSPDSQLASPANANQPAGNDAAATAPVPSNAAPANNSVANPPSPDQLSDTNAYLVQVAAVTKQEDADALVDALKKKQYPAFSTANAVDKLVHVQVGPYSDIKQAEDIRAKLMNDGYNPILKK